MREIKFRFWDKQGRKMYSNSVGVYPYDCKTPFSISSDGLMVHPAYEDHILMQYTGLKDKNGKEIYEGDILRLFNDNDQPLYDSGPVVFHDACFWVQFGDARELELYIDHGMYAVLGNVYENPELLEEKERCKKCGRHDLEYSEEAGESLCRECGYPIGR